MTAVNRSLAQANSVPRITNPAGITIKAGPGKTIMAAPIKRTEKPINATTTFLILFKTVCRKFNATL